MTNTERATGFHLLEVARLLEARADEHVRASAGVPVSEAIITTARSNGLLEAANLVLDYGNTLLADTPSEQPS